MTKLRVGQYVPTRLISRTAAAGNGTWSLPAIRMSQLLGDRDISGKVNLEVVTIAGSSMTQYGLTSSVSAAASPSSFVTRVANQVSSRLSITNGRARQFARVTPQDDPPHCSSKDVYTFAPHWAIVGQTYSTSSHDAAEFDYSKGASTTLGYGVSASGAYGTFTASGTTQQSATSDWPFGPESGVKSEYYRSKFVNSKFEEVCKYQGGATDISYSTRTTSYAGGTNVVSAGSAPKATKCVGVSSGSKPNFHTTTAITWTNGYDISGSIGTDLSAQTGYTTDASITYDVNHNGSICGVSAYPAQKNPYQLVAK